MLRVGEFRALRGSWDSCGSWGSWGFLGVRGVVGVRIELGWILGAWDCFGFFWGFLPFLGLWEILGVQVLQV